MTSPALIAMPRSLRDRRADAEMWWLSHRHHGRVLSASVAVAARTGLPSAFPCRGSRC